MCVSRSVFGTAQKKFEEKVANLQKRIEELHEHLAVKERELKKVQYLLQDGDSLAASVKKLTDDLQAAELRAKVREREREREREGL